MKAIKLLRSDNDVPHINKLFNKNVIKKYKSITEDQFHIIHNQYITTMRSDIPGAKSAKIHVISNSIHTFIHKSEFSKINLITVQTRVCRSENKFSLWVNKVSYLVLSYLKSVTARILHRQLITSLIYKKKLTAEDWRQQTSAASRK